MELDGGERKVCGSTEQSAMVLSTETVKIFDSCLAMLHAHGAALSLERNDAAEEASLWLGTTRLRCLPLHNQALPQDLGTGLG